MNPVETLETSKAVNTLKQLQTLGQSIWLDYIRRDLLTGGELKRLIEEDGLRGMTSNPAIFEKAIAGSGDVSRVASVASCFISRIDTLIDSLLNERIKKETDSARKAKLQALLGKIAIANGKLTYEAYQKIFSTPRWKALAAKGAQTQRVLWASTSTKNPAYRDVMYVEEMIGPDTVDTVPPATLEAFRDHGKPSVSLTEDLAGARKTMSDLSAVGISMKEATDKLTKDGVKLFADAFDQLLQAVEKNTKRPGAPNVGAQSAKLPSDLDDAVKKNLNDWRAGGKVRRLWDRDAS